MSIPSNSTPTSTTRLDYLDGLRGLAALYVVLFHCRSEFTWSRADGGFSSLVRGLTAWMNFGHYAVVVFIVLSGYCLMLPVVRSQSGGVLAGGVWGYLKRRARRTLPAYYGAIGFSLLLTACVPDLQRPVGAQWDRCLPAFRPEVLLSHLFLLHNLRFEWHQTIDAPLWSMATEWDIYLLFAVLLLPLWRRGGAVVAAGAAFLLGLLPHLLLAPERNFDWACPWFLGCFALGMAGAAVGFGQQTDPDRRQDHARPARLAILFAGAVLLICTLFPDWGAAHWVNVDPLVAAATACALVAAARRPDRQQGPDRALRCLASRPLRGLGAFSYSLYLTHFPLLALIHIPLRQRGLSADAAYLWLTLLAVPLSLLTAFLFAQVFERPFERRARTAQATQEAFPDRKAA